MLFGSNPAADVVLATLGLTRGDVGRYRDCSVANGEIAVYTRNGGGNREGYQDVFDTLAAHPCYLRDEDDDYDSTYATIYFRFPEEYAADLAQFDSGEWKPSERWQTLLAALGAAMSVGRHAMKHGWEATLAKVSDDRRILVSRDFPSGRAQGKEG